MNLDLFIIKPAHARPPTPKNTHPCQKYYDFHINHDFMNWPYQYYRFYIIFTTKNHLLKYVFNPSKNSVFYIESWKRYFAAEQFLDLFRWNFGLNSIGTCSYYQILKKNTLIYFWPAPPHIHYLHTHLSKETSLIYLIIYLL